MPGPWLLIETSGRGGSVGLAVGGALASRTLDPGRRHNRDLAPAAADLLREAGLSPADVTAVVVSVGPGSYTGLRVGVVSAKAWAFATGCDLVAVPTFHALAEQVTDRTGTLDVVSDGLQGLVYAQRFAAGAGEWHALNGLHLAPAADWAATLPPGGAVTGPAVALVEALLPPGSTRPAAERAPTLAGLLRAAERTPPTAREAVFTLEPLYLRPSSAEEQAARARA